MRILVVILSLMVGGIYVSANRFSSQVQQIKTIERTAVKDSSACNDSVKLRDFFKIYYVNDIKKNITADSTYLNEAFIVLDSLKLRDLVGRYSPCPEVPEFAKMITRAELLDRNWELYRKAYMLVSEEGPDFTPELPLMVDSILGSVKEPISAKQREDVDNLSYIASMYADAVDAFKARILDIREQILREETSQSKDYAASIQADVLPAYFSKNEVKNEYSYIISEIPCLKAIYDKWIGFLKTDFLSDKAVELEDKVLSFGVKAITESRTSGVGEENLENGKFEISMEETVKEEKNFQSTDDDKVENSEDKETVE